MRCHVAWQVKYHTSALEEPAASAISFVILEWAGIVATRGIIIPASEGELQKNWGVHISRPKYLEAYVHPKSHIEGPWIEPGPAWRETDK